MRKLMLPVSVLLALGLAPPALGADGVAVGHSGWTWGNPHPQGNTLRDVAFAGGRGYAAGDFGTLLETSNGGLSWRAGRTGTSAGLRRVQLLPGGVVLAGGGCVLRRSDDGGAGFRRLRATSRERGCRSRLVSFSFTDATVGFVLLRDGSVARTVDGGRVFSKRGSLPGTRSAGAGSSVTPADVAALSMRTAVAVA